MLYDRDGNYEIYYKRRLNNGGIWGNDIRLTYEFINSFTPIVAVYSENVHIFWDNEIDYPTEDYAIYHKKSTDNGETWSSDTSVVDTTSSSWIPEVSLYRNDVHIVWSDNRDQMWDIYYKHNLNEKPSADTLDYEEKFVYKGDSITLFSNASDDNDHEYDLICSFNYKHSTSSTWEDTCLSDITWDSIGWFWTATFTPSEQLETGLYDFRVRFTDSDELDSDWVDGPIQMNVRVHPEAVLTASSKEIEKDESVTFNASGSIGQYLVYYFDFGDGTIIEWQNEPSKTHVYSSAGTFVTKVKVRDSYGEESLYETVEIVVKEPALFDSNLMILLIALIIIVIIIAIVYKKYYGKK